MKPFIHYENYFDAKYFALLGNRWPTFKVALNLFIHRGGQNIVETGCWRFDGDVGGGESTKMFCEFLHHLDAGKIDTVDKSEKCVTECRRLTAQYNRCTVHLGDSVEFLQNWSGPPIDLLYLDSFDYPYGSLLEIYGGKEDIAKAAQTLKDMGEKEIVRLHDGIIRPCQRHCLREIRAAMPHLHDRSIVLIDDNDIPGGGKPRLAKPWLANQGWICLLDWQQTLWVKG